MDSPLTSTTMALPPLQDRYYFHSTPRTASTVLLRILNLPSQPNLNPAYGDGYFFITYFMTQRTLGLQGIHPSNWTASQTSQIRETLHSSIQKLSSFLRETEAKGQRCFIKEHSEFIFDPSAFSSGLSQKNQRPDQEFTSFFRESLPLSLLFPELSTTPTLNRHYYSKENHTLLPDAFLSTFRPTILIRHPALVFPSQYRAFSDIQKVRNDKNAWETMMTLAWARQLFHLYSKILPPSLVPTGAETTDKDEEGDTRIWPIVLEADEALSPQNDYELLKKYCRLVGFEEERMRFQWEVAGKGDLLASTEVGRRMNSTVNSSTGLVQGKLASADGINIEVEAIKWREEFGEEGGKRMEGWVRDAMPDYEFLRERRLRV